MISRRSPAACTAIVLSLVGTTLTACSSSLGPERDAVTRIVLSQRAVGASTSVIAADVAAAASSGAISLADVASIDVMITGVQAIRRGIDDTEEGGWVDLELSAAAQNPIDLLALPGSGIEIAVGELAAGEYGNVRIRFSDATISLNNDLSVGPKSFAAADSPHPLFIPSGVQTGIKIPTASFVVEDGGETVVIEFDPAMSVGTIVATGRGLLMTPVLKEGGGEEVPAE